MIATFKTPNCLQAPIKILSFFTLAILILWGTIGCKVGKGIPTEDIVSFLANVEPDSYQKVFTVVIGTKQATPKELNDLMKSDWKKSTVYYAVAA